MYVAARGSSTEAAPASAELQRALCAETQLRGPRTSGLYAHIAGIAQNYSILSIIRIGVSFEHRTILRKHSCWPMRRSIEFDFEFLDKGDARHTNRYAS